MFSGAFRELREDKDFFDVTLACDDEQLQAHKVILSACSPFFRTVLRRNRHEHPLLYLKGDVVQKNSVQMNLLLLRRQVCRPSLRPELHVPWRGECGPGGVEFFPGSR